MPHHLAQANVALMRASIRDPLLSGLAARIDEMNRLAEGSEGFVWRLPGSAASDAALGVFRGYIEPFEPERIFFNLSVWETAGHLERYTYRTMHVEMLRGKASWMAELDRPHLALWWVPMGHHPSIAECATRLRALHGRGPTPFAFTLAHGYPPPGI